MNSMVSIQTMVLNIDSAARSIGLRPGTSKDKKKKEGERKDNVDQCDNVLKSTEKAFDLIQKSIKAFFKANNEDYTVAKYDETADYFRKKNVVSGDVDVLVSNIDTVCGQITDEASKHSGVMVHHENGSHWKKSKTDKSRFGSLSKIAGDISLLVAV